MLNNIPQNIGVIGGGGWGTAISCLLINNNFEVKIWTYEKEVTDEINKYKKNSIYLPDISLPKSLVATNDLNEFADYDFIIFAIPTQFIRNICSKIKFKLDTKKIVNLAKGIERKTLFRVSEIMNDVLKLEPYNYAILTGPSHAEEVARKVPTTVVTASENPFFAKLVQSIFSNDYFRVYTSDDVIGCEIGGALKNVIAIASGIIDGLHLGDNTKAALITRGLAEITRLGVAIGANSLTFSGLSGLGDLIVTCSSKFSRNRMVGELIGRGKTLKQIINETKMIAEGISTTESAYELSKKHGVEMPITEKIYQIFNNQISPSQAIYELMTRQSKREWWW